MISIADIRSSQNKILVLGNHEPIIQSILDFDYLSGKKESSILGIISGRHGFAKLFFGNREILIPTFLDIGHWESNQQLNHSTKIWFLNLLSGRRTLSSTLELLLSNSSEPCASECSELCDFRFVGGTLFAENVPEFHSLKIIEATHGKSLVVGPASVGLIVPGSLKLGPIGGITPDQIRGCYITEPGNVAVFSASGGMTNELINIATQSGHRLSFALSFGGDRFPVLSPREAFILAEDDQQTKSILYYGELGGEDEYELAKLTEEGRFTKNVIAHIAGTVAGLFPESPQFGHAKAKADKERTTAGAKREALKSAGFKVSNSFDEFINLVNRLI